MKLLMFHVEEFWFRSNEYGEDESDGTTVEEAILVWIQSEADDVQNRVAVLRKMVKNIRWLASKLGTTRVILHSFAHLGESKSTPDLAEHVIEETADRLRERDFDVTIVPFGMFFEFKLHVKGPSIAKVFKQF
ncbi:MAG: threonyl-tRNA synthetase editing domain-containing protein [Candidatus Thorarchaeota archaeon]